MRFARHLPTLAATLAVSLCVLADDPPKDDGKGTQKESETRFFEFLRAWRTTVAHMDAGLTRSYTIESKGGEVDVTGTMEIVAKSPEPEVIAFDKKMTLDHEEELKGKRVELPPLLGGRLWVEPPPMQFPEKAKTTLEKDVEVKVGEKTLKCWKMTLTTDADAPMPNMNMAYWFSDDGRVGLVRATASSGTGKSMVIQLIGWKAGEK